MTQWVVLHALAPGDDDNDFSSTTVEGPYRFDVAQRRANKIIEGDPYNERHVAVRPLTKPSSRSQDMKCSD